MIYKKEYDLIVANYDLKKVIKFLENHNYKKQKQSLFENEMFFQKNICDDFDQEFEISVLITISLNKLLFEVNSVNSDRIAIGIKKYEKLLVDTCYSILVNDDYKEESWKKFYESVKKRKAAYHIAGFALDILDSL